MKYATILKEAIESSGISLTQICIRLAKREVWIDRAVLSKMQNGKLPPAKDEINVVLADILRIDPVQFRLAAAREMIPSDLYKLIQEAG